MSLGNKQSFPEINLTPKKSPLDKIFQLSSSLPLIGQQAGLPFAKSQAHHNHKHTEEIVSHTFHFDQPFDYQIFDQQLFVYLMLQSKGLYRMKGLVWFDGSKDQYIVQSVGKRLEIEVKKPWQANERKKSVMVFIGKNLQRAGIEKLINRCISKRDLTQY